MLSSLRRIIENISSQFEIQRLGGYEKIAIETGDPNSFVVVDDNS